MNAVPTVRTVGSLTPDALVLSADMAAPRAHRLLITHELTAAPVVDEDGCLAGVVGLGDLAAGLGGPAPGSSCLIGELMQPPPPKVERHTRLADAAGLMRAHAVDRLVVVDDHSRPLGIITAFELIRALALITEEFASWSACDSLGDR